MFSATVFELPYGVSTREGEIHIPRFPSRHDRRSKAAALWTTIWHDEGAQLVITNRFCVYLSSESILFLGF